MPRSRYDDLGVDVHKKGISAFRDSVTGIYKHSFCDIHPDPDFEGYGFVQKPDGAGSKPVQNYLNWKVMGNLSAFKGMAQDTLAMSVGDIFCVGIPKLCIFDDYIAINKLHVPKEEVIQIVHDEWKDLIGMLNGYGINITLSGGETADLPDQLRTLDISGSMHARYRLDSVITGEDIRPGDTIIGIASGGQAKYEKRPAGPIMANGLTLARHCLMHPSYAVMYPEIQEPGKEYTGPFSPTDKVEGIDGMIGEEITRPTRIFAPVFKGVIEEFGNAVHGIVFNTGGGHTKCLRVGNGIKYVKDDLPEPSPIFMLINKHGKVRWREMHEDFNNGIGAEMYVDPAVQSEVPRYIDETFDIDASRIGFCSRARGENKVRLETRFGNFNYRKH
jgi:phosphoribosylformylglycinamidine cyclo-ligase